jgi:hypothetical protein
MMSSTRKDRLATLCAGLAWLAAGVVGAAGLFGCGHQTPPRPVPTVGQLQPTDEPVVFDDEAMDMRQWSQSVSLYPSGTTQAFPLRWNYQGMETDYDQTNALLDPVMFLVESFTYPFRLALEPPGHMTNYAGPVVPPTYNAMPPLPPEPGAPPKVTPGMKFRDWVHQRQMWVHEQFHHHAEHRQAPEQIPPVAEPATTESTTEPTTTPASTEPAPAQPVTAPVGQ